MKTQMKKQQNQTNVRIKVLTGVIAMIGVLTLGGCQECLTDTQVRISVQNESVNSDKVPALAVFPDNDSTADTGRPEIYWIGSQSYAEKLMKIYENGNIPTLPANTGRGGTGDIICVPILEINF